jgi:NTP pyrophosphatase (non-canonical NTP hydrolase)
MHADDYQAAADKTAYPFEHAAMRFIDDPNVTWVRMAYLALKLNGEAGELAEEIGKALRDDDGFVDTERMERIIKELGDVQWYVAEIASEMNIRLSTIMQMNVDKLRDRDERGVLGGSGNDR